MDEPTSGLDQASSMILMKCLEKYVEATGCCMGVVIHQPSPNLFAMFDEVLVFNKGHKVFHGSQEEVGAAFRCAHDHHVNPSETQNITQRLKTAHRELPVSRPENPLREKHESMIVGTQIAVGEPSLTTWESRATRMRSFLRATIGLGADMVSCREGNLPYPQTIMTCSAAVFIFFVFYWLEDNLTNQAIMIMILFFVSTAIVAIYTVNDSSFQFLNRHAHLLKDEYITRLQLLTVLLGVNLFWSILVTLFVASVLFPVMVWTGVKINLIHHTLVLLLSNLVWCVLMLAILVLVGFTDKNNGSLVNQLATAIMSTCSLFSGLTIPFATAAWLKVLITISPNYWGQKAFIIIAWYEWQSTENANCLNEHGGSLSQLLCTMESGKMYINQLYERPGGIRNSLLSLCIMIVASLVIFCCTLLWRLRRKLPKRVASHECEHDHESTSGADAEQLFEIFKELQKENRSERGGTTAVGRGSSSLWGLLYRQLRPTSGSAKSDEDNVKSSSSSSPQRRESVHLPPFLRPAEEAESGMGGGAEMLGGAARPPPSDVSGAESSPGR
jgi:hypothetical protein